VSGELTVDGALREAAARLAGVGGTGRLDAALLLEHVTGSSRAAFIANGERLLAEDESARFAELVERRATGIPVAYLIGTAGFYGRTFSVNQSVLVPRPETEHIVDAVLPGLRRRAARDQRLADIGTGCGALAVTLAAELPASSVFATDLLDDALALARRNAARHGVSLRCTFLAGDLAAPLQRFGPFDAVCANLPYVPSGALPELPDPVAFEPRLALDGGHDGLTLYRRLLGQLPDLMAPDGLVVLEAAPPTIEGLAAAGAAAFPRARITIGSDYAGLARFISLSLG
jgi:release factor glutamine methyltransferase